MDGYIKYFDDGGKNMSFVTDNEEIYEKYNKIWEVIRKLLKVDFTVGPARDDKYLVAKLKIFDRINRTTFNNNNNNNNNNSNNNSDIDDAVDSHINFSVPDSYVEIINIIMEITIINQDKIILLILKIFTKIVTIIEIIMKKFTKNNKYNIDNFNDIIEL